MISLSASTLRQDLAEARASKIDAEKARRVSFLRALADDARVFENEMIAWITSRLRFMARVMMVETASFPAPWKHSDKFRGRFRVSTFVSMYRMQDPHVFEELGYAENESPFLRICKSFAEQGIRVADASDPTKGHGFWVSLSFAAAADEDDKAST